MVEESMTTTLPAEIVSDEITYPTSDGQPMADNTRQFRWIVTIQGGLDALYRDAPDVFVAGDLLWYPVQGRPAIRRAPDVMVVFGRPKGDRGAYLQWKEDQIAPQVVFEVASPGNTLKEWATKLQFYNDYGVEEYYIYDPDENELSGWLRSEGQLRMIDAIEEWTSPRLGIRFSLQPDTLHIYRPDGQRFLSYTELEHQWEAERRRAEAEERRVEQERRRTEQERERAEQERERAERLAARLRALGIDPDQPDT
jgi:Uma2 family endonuclease